MDLGEVVEHELHALGLARARLARDHDRLRSPFRKQQAVHPLNRAEDVRRCRLCLGLKPITVELPAGLAVDRQPLVWVDRYKNVRNVG